MAAKKTTKKESKARTPKKSEILSRGKCDWKCSCGSTTGTGYGLGVIGAAVYYISTATGFWMGVWGVIKALLWPAFLVYELLKFLGA